MTSGDRDLLNGPRRGWVGNRVGLDPTPLGGRESKFSKSLSKGGKLVGGRGPVARVDRRSPCMFCSSSSFVIHSSHSSFFVPGWLGNPVRARALDGSPLDAALVLAHWRDRHRGAGDPGAWVCKTKLLQQIGSGKKVDFLRTCSVLNESLFLCAS